MEARLNLPEDLIDQIVEKLAGRLEEKIQPSLMDVEQLATYLNVPKGWLYDRTRNKKDGIPHVKVGKYVRFNLQDVLEWLKNNE
jgi:excisionase family DNA binding protein